MKESPNPIFYCEIGANLLNLELKMFSKLKKWSYGFFILH